MVTEQHQYTSVLTDEGGRMSDGSRGGCRRNQNVGIAKGIIMMAMLCILKCDYDVRPNICRGTYVAINKLVTKSYKIIFKRMMT